MKLDNRTAVDNKILEQVLREAARGLGVRTSGVGIVVSTSRYRTNGVAYMCNSFRSSRVWLNTDCGFFKVSLPLDLNPLRCAERFYSTARHEWAHVRDFQDQNGQGTRPFSKRVNGRRPKHDCRPEELRAYDYVDEADKRIRRNGVVIAELACAIQGVLSLRSRNRQGRER